MGFQIILIIFRYIFVFSFIVQMFKHSAIIKGSIHGFGFVNILATYMVTNPKL